MSQFVTGVTAGGSVWTPSFVESLNQAKCIGCGRCYKVCPRSVLTLVDRADLMDEDEIDEYEDLDEDNTQVMTIANGADCIGCEACSKVCPKKCFTHSHLPLAA
jgi:Nif-specific ferredoxin III